MGRRSVGVVLAVVAVLVLTAGGVLAGAALLPLADPAGMSSEPAFAAEYEGSDGSVAITYAGGMELSASNGVESVAVYRYAASEGGASDDVALRVDGERVDHNVWAADGPPRAEPFPLAEGETAVAGVDRPFGEGERFAVVVETGEGDPLVDRWRIEDGEAVEY